MSTVVSLGHADTPINGVTALALDRAILNFGKDFRVRSSDAGKELVLTNLTSPVDRPEKLRVAFSEINNIYTGTGIDPSVSSPTKRGVSLLVQLTNVMSITDSTDPDYRIDLPLSAHMVIKVPSSEHITGGVVEDLVGRLLSGLYESGSVSTTRLESILRGSLAPADL